MAGGDAAPSGRLQLLSRMGPWVVAVVGSGVATMLISTYLATLSVREADDWLTRVSLFGTVLTFAGLTVAFYQLASTRTAAEQARDAAGRTADEIGLRQALFLMSE